MKGAAGGPAYERSFRWKVGQFRHLCQVFFFFMWPVGVSLITASLIGSIEGQKFYRDVNNR